MRPDHERRRAVHPKSRDKRYSRCMATIQVRDVPDDVHRIYQQRAALAGMSLQEYLRAELTRNARTRTPAELVAETEQRLASEGSQGFATRSSAALLRADRAEH
jgi:antitoxin FitA